MWPLRLQRPRSFDLAHNGGANHVLRSALVAMLEWMRGYFFLG
jgi:hypothetical protein